MRSTAITVLALLAACSLTLGWSPAHVAAQQQAGGDGRALDSNQQVGSGGVNQPQAQPDFRARNEIITGNVGGGRAFQGDINYRASGEFRDQLGSDDLFRFRAQSYSSGLNQLNAVQSQREYAIGDGTSIFRSYTSPAATGRITTQLVPRQLSVGGYTEYGDLTGGDGFTRNRLFLDGELTDDRLDLFGDLQDLQGRALEVRVSPLLGVRRDDDALLRERLLSAPDREDRDEADGDEADDAGDAADTRQELRQDERQSTAIDGRAYQLSAGVGTTDEFARRSSRFAPTLVLGQQLRSQVFAERADAADPATQQRLRRLEEQLFASRQADPGEDVYADLLAAVRDPEARTLPADRLVPEEQQQEEGELRGLETPTQRDLDRAERAREDARQRTDGEADATDDDEAQAAGAEQDDALEGLLERLDYELPRLRSLASDRDGPIDQLMQQAEQDLVAGNFFDAEDRYRRVLRARPHEPLARVGLVHAQLGAGLLRSAGLHLRGLLVEHPELIAAKYSQRLMPGGDRLTEVQQELQRMIREGEGGAGDAALLLAYLGYQGASRPLVRYGLASAEAAHPRDPLVPVLRRIWLDEDAMGGENGPNQPTNQGSGNPPAPLDNAESK